MSLHFSVFRGSQIKGADSASATSIFGRFLSVETCPEKHRETAQPDTQPDTLFSSRWLGCAASFGSLCEAQHLASQNPKKSLNKKCIEMQQNATKFGKIRNKKKRCCCFFLPGNWHSDNVSCVPVKGQHPHDPAFASRFGCGLRFL